MGGGQGLYMCGLRIELQLGDHVLKLEPQVCLLPCAEGLECYPQVLCVSIYSL